VVAAFETIAQALVAGEQVDIEGLGVFYVVKNEAQLVPGKMTVSLPSSEPDFEPDAKLVKYVAAQMKDHPERFGEEESVTEQPVVVKEEDKMAMPASQIEFRDFAEYKVEPDVLRLISSQLSKQFSVVPVELKDGELTLAMINPEDFDALQVVRKQTGLIIRPVLVMRDTLQQLQDQYSAELDSEVKSAIEDGDFGISAEDVDKAAKESVDAGDDDSPTVRIVNSLLKRAVKEGASDIHVEPYERKVIVRFRQDGVLHKKVELPKEIQSAVVARLKIMSNLKIDEQRLPQDGHLQITTDGRAIDFRLSTIPVVFGEKIVMRILDKSKGIVSIDAIGLMDRGLEVLKNNSERSHGMILVTGPTGSGKTTSLYAVLGRLMKEDVNILTLEDPVEYRIESINQSQVRSDIGYTFGSGMRAVVRQDPDIVMIGEIRDHETADMAVQAALTGHIVLSTLHTNSSAGAFPRLIDMGLEPFLITSSVHTVIAQRLARKICPDCIEDTDVSDEEKDDVKKIIDAMPDDLRKEWEGKPLKFKKGKGCEHCSNTGYKGRMGIFEVLDVTPPIQELILKRSSDYEINKQAVKEGMASMIQDGIGKALRGLTTLTEVWRVTKE